MFKGLAPIGWEFSINPFKVDSDRKSSHICKIYVFKNVVRIAINRKFNLKCGEIFKELCSSPKKVKCSKNLSFNVNDYCADSAGNLRWIEFCFFYKSYRWSDFEEATTDVITEFLNNISEPLSRSSVDLFEKYISIVSNIINSINELGYYFDKVDYI